MYNPYANVDWDGVQHLISANHWHCTSKSKFLGICATGIEHLPISNYIPSHITYPLTDNEFFAIADGEIPEGLISSPNSEKVTFADASMHVTCPGSTYNSYGHEWPEEEPKLSWRDKFRNILDDLQYEDGGGIIINHPVRSGAKVANIIEKLKFDDRVLGVEVYNHRAHRDYGQKGYFMNEWDTILSKGYRCFGFFTPDEHNLPSGYTSGDMREVNFGIGRNVLLVPEKTEHEALKAYRNGCFYGAYYGDRIKFARIEMQGNTFRVETDNAERIDFISYSLNGFNAVQNPVATVMSSHGSFETDSNTIFVRAIAYEDASSNVTDQPILKEIIFTQAIMLKSTVEISPPHGNVIDSYVRIDDAWKKISKGYEKRKGNWRKILNTKAY